MQNKAFSAITIKAVHDERREITGMASTPASDRVNDIVEPLGLSFAKEVPLLLNHDHSQPVGTVQFGAPTAKGLPFKATIAKVDEDGTVKSRTDEAWHSVKSGIIKGVSIGFRSKESKPLSNGGTRFTKAAIHELSLVAIPANPEAVISAFKSLDTLAAPAVIPTPTPARIAALTEFTKEHDSMTTKQVTPTRSALADQIIKAVGRREELEIQEAVKSLSPREQVRVALFADQIEQGNTKAADAVRSALEKSAVAASTTTSGDTSALYYPVQQAGIVLPPATTPIVSALANLGALKTPPNRRALTQAQLIEASEIPEGGGYPCAAGSIAFSLSSVRKWGVILTFTKDMLEAQGTDENVIDYVTAQLEHAANLGTDAFAYAQLTANAAAATTVQGALDAFTADARTACWIGSPATLASLRSPTETQVGPRGGFLMTLPALPSLAIPQGKLLLVDATRTAVFDGPQTVLRTDESTIVPDTAPDGSSTPPLYLFQQNMVAMRITKYADIMPLHQTQLVTLA
ncbi:HK97 family phage prohead protease [Caballeronia sp. ATUFL_M2_KS44]|uniref:HK97 family phage prohead protease n=1 Tax=Caballeronia sp. ATUFL_M2_KS44 TaxID=2921767 RepID=UPI0020282EE4|nr:HK97 family phage prohead protease [Caballeronia sp. ATUFL_M2_KS44]